MRGRSASRVLFRVDAGRHIGLGHLQRCLSLASAFRALGVGCHFLTNADPIAMQRIVQYGVEGSMLEATGSWSQGDLAQTITLAGRERSHIVVVDSDLEGDEYLRGLRGEGFFTCAIEDLSPHPFSSHLVVNGDAHAAQLSYSSATGDTQFLLGPDYALLRPEFWERASRVVRSLVQHVLVMMGGSDPHDLTPRIMQMLYEQPGEFAITVVVGPYFERSSQVEEMASDQRRRVAIAHAPVSILGLMLEADLAITAGGQTLYELACVGCPAVAVQAAGNQEGQMRVFAGAGSIQVAGHAQDEHIVEAIRQLLPGILADQGARERMARAGRMLVDGQGALRVARRILDESTRFVGNGLERRKHGHNGNER